MTKSTSTKTLESRYARCRELLEADNQQHLLRWWPELDPPSQTQLLDDIESIPWNDLHPIIESHVRNTPQHRGPMHLEPAPIWPHVPKPQDVDAYDEAESLGRKLIRDGRVAAFTVAGGQGTRLGFDGPKGLFPITPVRRKTFFQLFAETILAVQDRYGAAIPWYIMTSAANHDHTEHFFNEHGFFGLDKRDVLMFPQAMLPVFDFEGAALLSQKHRLATAPDGHGGSLKALVASGAARDMQKRGVEIISYFQVDNPLVKPFDPLFIGLHAESNSEMSAKVTPKVEDTERVGNVCLQDGRVAVVEYTDFPNRLAQARNPDGSRKFDAGNLAIHLLSVAFVQRVAGRDLRLPYHRAEKAVTFVDPDGKMQTPSKPNAVKLETFVFDALPLAENAIVLEIERAEEFTPVKNARGVDSVESAVSDQVSRAARWLEAAGVTIPRKPDGRPDANIEIAPSFALDATHLNDCSLPTSPLKRSKDAYFD